MISLDGPAVARSSADDPIYRQDGTKRPRDEIVALMTDEVMPFARDALGPVVGGGAYVTCETCHGKAPERVEYRIPAIAALPHTLDVGETTLQSAQTNDVQFQNAVVDIQLAFSDCHSDRR